MSPSNEHYDSRRHDHAPSDATGTTRLVLAIVFNGLITAAEFIAGVLAGSLALIADATHNLSDTASMGTSLIARRLSARAADDRRTFGYDRAELIGAFVNLITLVLIALYLTVEAVQRVMHPTSVDGTLMIWVGAGTLVGNVATAAVLYAPSRDSLNLRSAFVHIVADALGSVAVIAGGLVILWFDWTIIDPILTASIAAYILIQSYGMLRETISILMESAPRGFDIDAMADRVASLKHVGEMHHIHIWRLDETRVALEAHVATCDIKSLSDLDRVKQAIKRVLDKEYGIDHATLELEYEHCSDVLPHDEDIPSGTESPARPPAEAEL
ncbi:cation diffusion facilitator family transporter [Longibacter sp.]|uniref:cation diffusion facilitator family transporter n=1 Tax=Longibacter sp. TaxID=2045415 RepID=UPI003EBFA0C8